jgi:hypothetical protein
MAKAKSGLPEGFDINVSSADLTGPATLPGYLDDDPVLELAKMTQRRAAQTPASIKAPVRPSQEPPEERAASPVLPKGAATPAATVNQGAPAQAAKPAIPNPPRRRLQVNLDPEGERMVEELLDLVSDQSSERRIKVSEFVQALVLNLYVARSEINLGSLPQRGRWGSPTAKSFPSALAQAFCEAIVTHDRRIGGNQFKKAIGG